MRLREAIGQRARTMDALHLAAAIVAAVGISGLLFGAILPGNDSFNNAPGNNVTNTSGFAPSVTTQQSGAGAGQQAGGGGQTQAASPRATVTPAATPTPGATRTPTARATPDWRAALAETPELIEVVEQVLAGPDAVIELAETVEALCSFHGERFTLCAERNLGPFDRFEAVVVSDLLHCEGCEVPPERARAALERIYRRGGVPAAAFWGGLDDPGDGGAGAGVELIAAWVLDDRTADLIGERWPELVASHALAFRAVEPQTEGDVATGFLLFVDPSGEHPVAVIEPTGETWTAFDTARELGPWQELYSKP